MALAGQLAHRVEDARRDSVNLRPKRIGENGDAHVFHLYEYSDRRL